MNVLAAVLRCPSCGGERFRADEGLVACEACGRGHALRDGILHVDAGGDHDEVVQERASVPATEMSPALGGWSEAYSAGTDPRSPLALAYLSLPYGDESAHFAQPGYFANVRHFAPEFDFVVSRLPPAGRLLDLGADGTWSTARLAQRGLTCVALDITDHLSLAHLFHTAYPPYALVNADMHAPVFRDGAFDAVTAFNALHHSKRLDGLAANIARMLAPGGVLGFVEPYVQNVQQASDFGAPQSAVGINENVHTVGRWHEAFTRAGLALQVCALTDSFNAIYIKPREAGVETRGSPLDTFYRSALDVSPHRADGRAGTPIEFAVTLQCLGRVAWSRRGPEHIRLSYHVSRVTPGGPQMIAFDNDRTLLSDFVAPGAPVCLGVPVTLTEPGEYEIEFDLVHETRAWFKDRGGRTAVAHVTIG